MSTPTFITVAEFADTFFSEKSRPDLRTIRSWVRKGQVPGRTIGKIVYVDSTAFKQRTGNSLADRVLARRSGAGC